MYQAISKFAKKAMTIHATIYNALWSIIYNLNSEHKFAFIYYLNLWGTKETASGQGSTIKYTEKLRKEFPSLINKYEIQSIFDAPCGDFNWFKMMNLPIEYIGGDIVRGLIKNNEKNFGKKSIEFIHFDITKNDFPIADLWFCRDCFFHLKEKEIIQSLQNFIKSKISYIFTTCHTEVSKNIDLPREGFRLLDLRKPPYKFPAPLYMVPDYIPGFPPRSMFLWKREQIEKAILEMKN